MDRIKDFKNEEKEYKHAPYDGKRTIIGYPKDDEYEGQPYKQIIVEIMGHWYTYAVSRFFNADKFRNNPKLASECLVRMDEETMRNANPTIAYQIERMDGIINEYSFLVDD